MGPTAISLVCGISKAYTTRVGAGPFPTEQFGEIGEGLRQRGAEFGATTGRPRRCGWLDMVVVNTAVRLNGLNALALTKLDVLSGFPTLKIAVAYRYKGKLYDEFSSGLDLAACEPVYEELPGFSGTLSQARELSDLPEGAQKYLRRIEELCGVPITLVSVGPQRGETMVLENPFRR